LELVQAGAVPWIGRALTIAADDEAEHALAGKDDEFVVTVGVAGVSTGMAVYLCHHGQAEPTGGPAHPVGLDYSIWPGLGGLPG